MKSSPTSAAHRDPAGALIRCVQFAIVAVLAGVGLSSQALQLHPETVLGAQCWGMVGLYAWSVWSWYRLTRRLFDWYVIFLTAAFVFNGGQTFLEVLHLNELGILDAEFTATTVMQTLYLVELSLAAFHWGALTVLGWLPAPMSEAPTADRTSAETLTSLRLVGGALLVIAAPFAAMLLKEAVEIVLSGGYFALYQQKAPTGLGAGPKVLSAFLIPSVLYLLAASRDSRALQLLAIAVVLGYSAINFFLGVRHEAAILLVAFVWLWDRQISPIRMTWIMAGGAFTVLVLFPLIAATRNTSGSERVSFDYLVEQYTTLKNPAVEALHEMGGSMMTVAHTINLVPSQHEFEYGVGYAYGVLTLFPNFFWELHPTIARKIPSSWLTWQIDPYTAEQGGGLGYSFIAEAYLNFGWYGLTPVMFCFGLLAAWAVRWADQSGRGDRAAAVAAAFCFLVFFVRAEVAVVLRGVVWYTFMPYIGVLLLTLTQRAIAGQDFRLSAQGSTSVITLPPASIR